MYLFIFGIQYGLLILPKNVGKDAIGNLEKTPNSRLIYVLSRIFIGY
jgi:hypothetical protein